MYMTASAKRGLVVRPVYPTPKKKVRSILESECQLGGRAIGTLSVGPIDPHYRHDITKVGDFIMRVYGDISYFLSDLTEILFLVI